MIQRSIRATILILILQLLVGAAPQSGASIDGVVTGSNQPLADSEILLVQSNVPSGTAIVPGNMTATTISSVKTDSSGKFVIRAIQPGSYQLFAAHNGFVRQEYGQKSAYHSGTLIVLSAGQALHDINFKLVETGTVTGRVSDINAQLLQGITVQLLRPAYDSDGRRMLRLIDNAITNDLGEYRLYWITPGRYYVAADASRSSLEMQLRSPSSGIVAGTPGIQMQIDALRGRNEVVDQGYTKSYYINTTDASRAVAIDVRTGTEFPGINLELPRLDRFHVRGHLVDANTGTSTGREGAVSLSPLEPGTSALPTTSFDRSTGAFEVSNVPAGSYALDASMLAANPATTLSSSTRMRVDVAGDMDNLVVPIRYGTSISGRIDIEGLGTASDLPGYEKIQARLASTLFSQSNRSLSGKISANGTFAFENVSAGEYRAHFTGLPAGTYVKTALIGDKDILQNSLVVGTISPPMMTILISRNAAEISGTIMDANLKQVPGIQAVLIPDRQRDQHDIFKTVVSDSTGHFMLTGIAPGDYKLFAWEDLEPYSYFDEAVLQQFESRGRPIHTMESSRENVTVTLIPAN